jgi:hypothetical protein
MQIPDNGLACSSRTAPQLRPTVIGVGYLRPTHATCMADLGHEVLAIDVDRKRIEKGDCRRGAVLRARPRTSATQRPRNRPTAFHHLVCGTSGVRQPRSFPLPQICNGRTSARRVITNFTEEAQRLWQS